MTPEERNDYNKLTKEGQKFYDLYKGMHPDWGHAQLITMVTICVQDPFGPKCKGDGKTIKEIFAECVRKADAFMEENFPGLYPSVKDLFYRIGNAIKRAAQVTWEFLVNLFS